MTAGLAYLLLPVTGLLASSLGHSPRTRFHGAQAIVIGVLWPLALWGASAVSPSATKVVFLVGALVWLGFMFLALFGADPRLPILGRALESATQGDPKER